MVPPVTAYTLNGGCTCKSIRYTIAVPPWAERPPNPYKSPGADIGDLRLPFFALDHCNDCRSATGGLLPGWIICPRAYFSVEIKAKPSSDHEVARTSTRLTAEELVALKPADSHSTLTVYNGSPNRMRAFCSVCGTSLFYWVDAPVHSIVKRTPMIDVLLGTLDRKDLEQDWVRPERRLWCGVGVPWLNNLVKNGAGDLPAADRYFIDVPFDG